MRKRLTLAAVAAMSLAMGLVPGARAAVVGTDDASASAYSGGWSNSSNGSTSANQAFQAWSLQTSPGSGYAGFYIGTSANVGGNIDASGKSFAMYSNTDTAATADAYRSFSSALSTGQTFSIDLSVNYGDGNRGLDIKDGGGANVFNFNFSGSSFAVNGVTTGGGTFSTGYSGDSIVHVALTQTSGTGGTWTITRAGSVTGSASGTYTGLASQLHLYMGGISYSASQNDFAANNLSIVPEPASLAVLGLGALGMLRRRK